ncbi:MAG: CinA family protein [Anaerolineales bacterium]|nr:CinA family protein [Anaerolineales bacterium]
MPVQLEMKIQELCQARGLKVCTAESCTGGLISHRITDIPGSSEYFMGGIVAYSYEAKAALLGVSWDTLNGKGAVSPETVLEMARGARTGLQSDIAISVSGIAGPGGGTAEKPVGATWIGLVTPDGEWTRHFLWNGNREQNKQYSCDAALRFILDYLEGTLS